MRLRNTKHSVKHLKPKFILIILKNSILTSKKTQYITITKLMLMLMGNVYSNYMKSVNRMYKQNAELLTEKTGGMWCYR
jgi:hypothetical protein